MATIIFEYDENNQTVNGMFGVIAAMPGVKSFGMSIAQQNKAQRAQKILDRAKKFDMSVNKNAPQMTMEEIVQEVRDYRNGK
ncbi:MAG: hypothetical protein FWH59_03895 [Lentimicrobiaceae bacterium]|nr:hypothetical protein [Lentimicrobiaceae bacterium]